MSEKPTLLGVYRVLAGETLYGSVFRWKKREKIVKYANAGMAKLADALGLGPSGRKVVEVQILLPVPEEPD